MHDNTPVHFYAGIIHCGHCGKNYKYHLNSHQSSPSVPVYLCPTMNSLGKDYCPNKFIPEQILNEKTAEVLGVTTVDRTIIEKNIEEILVPENGKLIYKLTDGREVEIEWQHHSRRDSWTEEMKQAAKEKALSRRRKETEHGK